MHINIPRESDITFNATRGSFDAQITVRDCTGVYFYAAEVQAPLQAEMAMISKALVETARKMHLAPNKGLHLRNAPLVATRLAA